MSESRVPWITITEGATGGGDGMVSYSVAANPGGSPRAGLVMIAGQPLLIRQAGNQTCATTNIAVGQTVNGALSASGCRSLLDPGVAADRYTFTGVAGQRVLISLKSTSFDAYLTLITPDGEVAAQNDDFGHSVDAQIPNYGMFTLTADGVYTIEASTIEPGKTGGYTLALQTESARTLPLPNRLGGTRVRVIVIFHGGFDAPIFFASPDQINFQAPENLPLGTTLIEVENETGLLSRGVLKVEKTAPALFTAESTGQGLPAATALRIKPDGTQIYEPVVRFDPAQNKIVAVPIDLSGNDQVFLLLFGTGIRGRTALSAVGAKIGGDDAEVLFAGAQGGLVGLDQVNLRLSSALAGRGEVDVTLTVEGKAANTVKIVIK